VNPSSGAGLPDLSASGIPVSSYSASGHLDPAIPAPSGDLVFVLSGDEDREWAARAVVALSAAWTGAGRKVVLTDLHLEAPLLSGEGNDSDDGSGGGEIEGIVDILLYGASPSRVMKPGPGGASLIPCGTYAPDPGEIHRHPGWVRLRAGLRADGGLLMIFAPAGELDPDLVTRLAGDVVLLGSARESAMGRQLLAEAESQSRAESGMRLHGEGGRVIGWVALPEDSTPEDTESAALVGTGRTSRESLVTFGPLAVLTVLFLAMLFLIVRRPAESSPPLSVSAEVDLIGTPAVLAIPGNRAEFRAYSVSVTAFPTLDAALEETALDREKAPSVDFFVSPEDIQGVLYYRVLAGMLHDTESANRLRDDLLEAEVIEESDAGSAWTALLSTPLAFELGLFPSQEEAAARVEMLAGAGIPAYTAAVPFDDGSSRWEVYAGAYRDPSEAVWMKSALLAARVEGALVSRVGPPVTATE
jgi:hypothetical protein